MKTTKGEASKKPNGGKSWQHGAAQGGGGEEEL